MGKRSLKTTKSGKYINPTDQARKEQRRRELKKNKKQREMVRAAIIKSKEPKHLLEEMELLDEMEFNPVKSASLSLKVLKDKRKKLKETLDKIQEMMEKDTPESVGEFRQMMAAYEKRRAQRLLYYEQVKNAERVRPDQIPLPSELPPPPSSAGLGDIPLPGRALATPLHGILKKPTIFVTDGSGLSKVVFRPLKNVPLPPPCAPPELSDSDDEASDSSSSRSSNESVDSDSPLDSSSLSESDSDHEAEPEQPKPKKSLRFAEDVPLESSKDTRLTVVRERSKSSKPEEDETPYDPEQPVEAEAPRSIGQPPANLPPYMPPSYPPPMMNPRMPPPPFGTLPGYPDVQPHGNVRRLPGGKLVLSGPPGVVQAAPAAIRHGKAETSQLASQQAPLPHQMAPPPVDSKVTTIEKKAQLKNLLQESTKFVPPQLKVRREYKDQHGRLIRPSAPRATSSLPSSSVTTQSAPYSVSQGAQSSAAVAAAKGADKDDSYAQFMKSLEGLL